MSVTTDFKRDPKPDVIITQFMSELSTFLEMEIKSKWDTLGLYKQILKSNPEDQVATEQINTNVEELRNLIKSLLDVRKDSEFMNPDTANIIQSIESICPDCGEVKKKEQVTLIGPHSTPKLDKKKKKKIAQVPNRFEFVESKHEWLGSGLIDEAKILTFDHSSSFVGRVTYEKADESMEIVLDDAIYQFCSVPRQIYNGFREAGSKGKFFNSRVKGLWDC